MQSSASDGNEGSIYSERQYIINMHTETRKMKRFVVIKVKYNLYIKKLIIQSMSPLLTEVLVNDVSLKDTVSMKRI